MQETAFTPLDRHRKIQTIDATNHFLHISCHGLDPAAQPIVLGNNLQVLLQPKPWKGKKINKFLYFSLSMYVCVNNIFGKYQKHTNVKMAFYLLLTTLWCHVEHLLEDKVSSSLEIWTLHGQIMNLMRLSSVKNILLIASEPNNMG